MNCKKQRKLCAGRRIHSFYVPEDVQQYFRKALSRGKKCEKQWQDNLNNSNKKIR